MEKIGRQPINRSQKIKAKKLKFSFAFDQPAEFKRALSLRSCPKTWNLILF
jgi:hypothetical protein